jgi:hypothetical protein
VVLSAGGRTIPKIVRGLNAPPPAVLEGRRGGAVEDWFLGVSAWGGIRDEEEEGWQGGVIMDEGSV